MSAMEHSDQIRAMRESFAGEPAAPAAIADRWQALHKTANEIAEKAALAHEEMDGELASFPLRVAGAGGTRAWYVKRGLEDMDAVLQPGLTALRLIESRGLDTTAPALALWREFYHARAAVLSLCPPAAADSLAGDVT